MMMDVKLPLPEPSLVLVERATVGFGDVLQQTPRTITESPPESNRLPPHAALVELIPDIETVDKIGTKFIKHRIENP